MNFEIILATSNKHKLQEVRDILSPHGIIVYGLSDLNLSDPNIIEGDTSYMENALLKATEISKYTNYPIIADDSGLEIHALDNFPGVHSSRFIDECGGRDEAFTAILEKMFGMKDRSASFTCTMCLINTEDKPLYFIGEAPGEITETVSSVDNGFGYDPIFYSKELNKTYSEATEEEKNRCSHRAKALIKLLTYLRLNGYINK